MGLVNRPKPPDNEYGSRYPADPFAGYLDVSLFSIPVIETLVENCFVIFRASELHEEKERLSRSMGACRNKDVLEKVLEFSMSSEIR